MTYEDVKLIRENPTLNDIDYTELQKMIDIAIEKQIPRLQRDFVATCTCGKTIYPHMNYCNNCGQALKWGAKNE